MGVSGMGRRVGSPAYQHDARGPVRGPRIRKSRARAPGQAAAPAGALLLLQRPVHHAHRRAGLEPGHRVERERTVDAVLEAHQYLVAGPHPEPLRERCAAGAAGDREHRRCRGLAAAAADPGARDATDQRAAEGACDRRERGRLADLADRLDGAGAAEFGGLRRDRAGCEARGEDERQEAAKERKRRAQGVHGGDSGVDTNDLAGPRERSSSSNELAVVIGDSTAQHLFDFESGREHMQQDLMETFSARWTGEEETLTKGRLRPEAVPHQSQLPGSATFFSASI